MLLRLLALALAAAVLVGIAAFLRTPSSPSLSATAPHATGAPGAMADRLVRRRFELGRSVKGRPISAVQLGDPDAQRRLLVVGCIHGNEPAGIAIARRLASSSSPTEQQVWTIPDLNPDGVARDTRQNAHGVDLNRNFPMHWHPLGPPGSLQYAGPRPLSEPESRIVRALILRLEPQVTIWFHQPLGLVDESGGRIAVERRFAHLVGLPLERLARYPGSAVGWTNRRVAGGTSFVVELPPGRLVPRAVGRYARSILRLRV